MTAIAGTVVAFRSMADGTLRLQIGLNEQESKQAMSLLCDVGASVAIARLSEPDAPGREQDEGPDDETEHPTTQPQAPYSAQAEILYRSAFFRTPDVWRAIGSDADFLAWLREQPCCWCKAPAPSEAAHVRRISSGAGVGIKPEYSAIPMCHEHHRLQHEKGESFLAPQHTWDKARIRYLQDWGWARLKADLGYEHWHSVPPPVLKQWAGDKGLGHLLPGGYAD